MYIQKFFSLTDKVTITFNAEPLLVVSANENYLQVIIQNLSSNAIKALKNTPGARIDWDAGKDGAKIILSITDNGPGMSNDNAKILSADSMAINAKIGFGLHLIRDLANAIRYEISVQSQPGEGTTFTLSAIPA